MSDEVVITYEGEQVSAPKEVAEFLEQERRREQAQAKAIRNYEPPAPAQSGMERTPRKEAVL